MGTRHSGRPIEKTCLREWSWAFLILAPALEGGRGCCRDSDGSRPAFATAQPYCRLLPVRHSSLPVPVPAGESPMEPRPMERGYRKNA